MGSPAKDFLQKEIQLEEESRIKGKTRREQKPKRSKKIRLFLIFAAIAYIAVSFGGLQIKTHQINAQISALEEEKQLLLEEQQQLLQKKAKLEDPLYIERRAREDLGFIKPGEKILLPAVEGEAIPLKLDGIDDIRD